MILYNIITNVLNLNMLDSTHDLIKYSKLIKLIHIIYIKNNNNVGYSFKVYRPHIFSNPHIFYLKKNVKSIIKK